MTSSNGVNRPSMVREPVTDAAAMAGLSPELMLSGLQLLGMHDQVTKKLDEIKSVQKECEAYRKQQAYITSLQDQLGKASEGDVIGSPEKVDFGPNGQRLNEGFLEDSYQVGWGVTNNAPDADGIYRPKTVKEGEPGFRSVDQHEYNGNERDGRVTHTQVYLDKNLTPEEASKEAAAFGGKAAPVYCVNSQSLKDESQRIASKIEDLNSQIDIMQTELERLTKQSEEIVSSGKKQLELFHESDQKLLSW